MPEQCGIMLMSSPKSGQKRPQSGDIRWQWRSAKQWNDFAPGVSEKLEYAHQGRKKLPMKIWDGRFLREVELGHMRQMPGRRELRRLLPEAQKYLIEPSDDGPTQSASKGASRRPSTAPAACQAGNTSHQHQRGSDESRVLQKFVHPGLAKMQELRFEFSPVPPQENRGDHNEGKLGDLNSLAEEYAILMTEHWLLKGKMPILPLRGSPMNVMAALSLALFAAEFTDVLPLSDKRRRETVVTRLSNLKLERTFSDISTHMSELSPVPSEHTSEISVDSDVRWRMRRPRPAVPKRAAAMGNSSSAPQLGAGAVGRPFSAPAATGRPGGRDSQSRFMKDAGTQVTRPLIPFISLCIGPDSTQSRSNAC